MKRKNTNPPAKIAPTMYLTARLTFVCNPNTAATRAARLQEARTIGTHVTSTIIGSRE